MEKLRVKTSFIVFVPLESEPYQVVRSDGPKPNFGFSLDTNCGRVLFSITLFCKQRVTSKEYEQPDCLCWATRTPLALRKRTDEQQPTLALRLKVKQGAFDFRKSKKRFIRLQIECGNSEGQLIKTATSEFFQLLPRKRTSDIFEEDNKGVILPLQWRNNHCIGNIRHVFQLLSSPSGCFTDEEDSVVTPYDGPETPMADDNSECNSPKSEESSSEQILLRSEADREDRSAMSNASIVEGYEVYDSGSSSDSDVVLQSHEDLTDLHGQPEPRTTGLSFNTVLVQRHSQQNEQYAVLHNGNAEVVGNFRALNFYKASDINIKEDIRLLTDEHDPRDVLLKISGVSYKFKPGTTHSTQRRFVGYIAQQIESVVPEAVQLIDGVLHVDYESLIPYLSESIKQNYSDVNALKAELHCLKLVVVVLVLAVLYFGLLGSNFLRH